MSSLSCNNHNQMLLKSKRKEFFSATNTERRSMFGPLLQREIKSFSKKCTISQCLSISVVLIFAVYLLFNGTLNQPIRRGDVSDALVSGNCYIFGYGSLINSKSRQKTGITGDAIPVRVHHMKRGWIYDVDTLHHPTVFNTPFTAVGAQMDETHSESTVNGVIFPLECEEVSKYDEREARYQRQPIATSDIEVLGNAAFSKNNLIVYAYIVPDEIALSADSTEDRRLLRQSYIDKFISGCFEVGGIKMATECVETTEGWNGEYDNDREQSEFSMTKIAAKTRQDIDDLLDQLVPQLKS